MKISYNWIKELLPDLELSPEEIADLLTVHSFETEIAREYSIDPNIKAVQITGIDKHPNADRLRLATVTDGKEEITVVCGAPNISVGDIVPYSPPGTKVYDDKGETFKIKEANIRDYKSPGMLNSLRELGLGTDHGGIYILPPDTRLGASLAEYLPDDTVLELDITPNRAHDCLSHLGVAREVAALTGLSVQEPEIDSLPEKSGTVEGFELASETMEHTSRYMGLVLSSVNNNVTPLWMQARLLVTGNKPISALVDITNYVMLEIGNPSHAFDVKKLPGKKIGVRFAKDREKITLLDDKEYVLGKKELVITADDKPVALAGVMGGRGSEVSEDTVDVFLEIANFHPYTIQQTSANIGLRTEAAVRFAKEMDPNLAVTAGQRLVYLYKRLTGGNVQGMLDFYPRSRQKKTIDLVPLKVSSVAGMEISLSQTKEVLERLRMKVEDKAVPWRVDIPTDRLDIDGEHDLVEEVIRVIGLNNIPAAKIEEAAVLLPERFYMKEVIRNILFELGLTETYNYSFEPADTARIMGLSESVRLEITNPVSPEQKYLRSSLLPGLLKNFVTNKDRFHKKFSKQERDLFEVGAIFKPGKGKRVPGVIEQVNLAGMVVGDAKKVRSIVEALLAQLNLRKDKLTSLQIKSLSPAILKKIKYKLPVAYFELNLGELIDQAVSEPRAVLTLSEIRKQPVEAKQYLAVSRYPSVFRDLSLLVETKVAVETVREIIERAGGSLVVDTDLFDEYEPAGSDKKGLAFHIEYQAHERTLTDNEVNNLHRKIESTLRDELQVEIR